MGDESNADQKKQDNMLDSFSRSRNILISRALGSTVGCVCLGALYLLIPTLDRVVANYREIRLIEVECLRRSTQLNFCSSDLKQCRADMIECKK